MSLSAHTRLALDAAFAPVEIISEEHRPSRGGSTESRLHFDGVLDGARVNVLITTGGPFLHPRVAGMAWETDGPSEKTICARVRAIVDPAGTEPDT